MSTIYKDVQITFKTTHENPNDDIVDILYLLTENVDISQAEIKIA
jgi:hypothetical protein